MDKDQNIGEMNILEQMIKDPWTGICFAGTYLAITMKWMVENLTPFIAIIGSFLGLILLVLGIVEKIRSNKLKSMEIEKGEILIKRLLDKLNK